MTLEAELQRRCETHLDACREALYETETHDLDAGNDWNTSPAFGPFCGCSTCEVREVLAMAAEVLDEWCSA